MKITKNDIKNAQKDINFFYIDGKPKEFIYRDLVKNNNIKLLDVISIERRVKKLNEKAIKKGYRLKENGDVFLDMSFVIRPQSKLFEPTRQKNIYKT